MSISTLPAAGGLDVNELSQKLSSIPIQEEEGQGEGTREESEASSTVAMFGSEGGMSLCLFVCLFVCVCVFVCAFVCMHVTCIAAVCECERENVSHRKK